MSEGDLLHVVASDNIGPTRRNLGLALIWGSPAVLALVALVQVLQVWGGFDFGFTNWRPTLYAFVFYAACLCWGQVLAKGEQGKRILFVLPAALEFMAFKDARFFEQLHRSIDGGDGNARVNLRHPAVQRFHIGVVGHFAQHAGDHPALFRDAQALIQAQRLDVDGRGHDHSPAGRTKARPASQLGAKAG